MDSRDILRRRKKREEQLRSILTRQDDASKVKETVVDAPPVAVIKKSAAQRVFETLSLREKILGIRGAFQSAERERKQRAGRIKEQFFGNPEIRENVFRMRREIAKAQWAEVASPKYKEAYQKMPEYSVSELDYSESIKDNVLDKRLKDAYDDAERTQSDFRKYHGAIRDIYKAIGENPNKKKIDIPDENIGVLHYRALDNRKYKTFDSWEEGGFEDETKGFSDEERDTYDVIAIRKEKYKVFDNAPYDLVRKTKYTWTFEKERNPETGEMGRSEDEELEPYYADEKEDFYIESVA